MRTDKIIFTNYIDRVKAMFIGGATHNLTQAETDAYKEGFKDAIALAEVWIGAMEGVEDEKNISE